MSRTERKNTKSPVEEALASIQMAQSLSREMRADLKKVRGVGWWETLGFASVGGRNKYNRLLRVKQHFGYLQEVFTILPDEVRAVLPDQRIELETVSFETLWAHADPKLSDPGIHVDIEHCIDMLFQLENDLDEIRKQLL
ncbi:MAG: hypothetical protein MR660_07255 [Peptoniphilaceae bacterium]|nr:hypothetical protein [Peptoniphilaceae bacterium]MDY4197091.1 hypothetical protein [Peptoniphilaceae bacterium]MDY6146665.1 hypothetical protein [Peptoniphilaceae bacterium]